MGLPVLVYHRLGGLAIHSLVQHPWWACLAIIRVLFAEGVRIRDPLRISAQGGLVEAWLHGGASLQMLSTTLSNQGNENDTVLFRDLSDECLGLV